MAEQNDVKVFVSWSGEMAKAVALALRQWLPLVVDGVVPWVSDTDIAAGQRGLREIEAELADTRFGIVVVTAENQHASWLNYEAGALSKTVGGNVEHRVVPLLVDLSSAAELVGPLTQFQAKTAQQDGVRDVVRSLAVVAGKSEAVTDMRFDPLWRQLEEQITAARDLASGGDEGRPEPRPEGDMLDEILLHVRSLRSDLEGPAHREPTPTRAQRQRQEFQEFVTKLAAAHDMDVFEIEGTGWNDRRVTLAPKHDYDSDAEAAFRRAFRDQASQADRKVEISVIPF